MNSSNKKKCPKCGNYCDICDVCCQKCSYSFPIKSIKFFYNCNSEKEVKARHHDLVKKYHPDIFGVEGNEILKEIHKQMESVLKDISSNSNNYSRNDYYGADSEFDDFYQDEEAEDYNDFEEDSYTYENRNNYNYNYEYDTNSYSEEEFETFHEKESFERRKSFLFSRNVLISLGVILILYVGNILFHMAVDMFLSKDTDFTNQNNNIETSKFDNKYPNCNLQDFFDIYKKDRELNLSKIFSNTVFSFDKNFVISFTDISKKANGYCIANETYDSLIEGYDGLRIVCPIEYQLLYTNEDNSSIDYTYTNSTTAQELKENCKFYFKDEVLSKGDIDLIFQEKANDPTIQRHSPDFYSTDNNDANDVIDNQYPIQRQYSDMDKMIDEYLKKKINSQTNAGKKKSIKKDKEKVRVENIVQPKKRERKQREITEIEKSADEFFN